MLIILSCIFVSEHDLNERLQSLPNDTEEVTTTEDTSLEEDTAIVEDTAVEDTAIVAQDTSLDEEDTAVSEEDPCQNSIMVSHPVYIEESYFCDWANNGNLSPQQGQIRARSEKNNIFYPNIGEHICNVRFAFESNMGGLEFEWGFDDQMMMLINNYVIVASQKTMLNELLPINNTYIYSWNTLKNTELSYEIDYFAIGNTSNVSFPEPNPGVLEPSYINLKSQSLRVIREKVVNDNHVTMSIISFGDNDDMDCYHPPFQTTIELLINSNQ